MMYLTKSTYISEKKKYIKLKEKQLEKSVMKGSDKTLPLVLKDYIK